jgi:hypothetical protein
VPLCRVAAASRVDSVFDAALASYCSASGLLPNTRSAVPITSISA